MNDAASLTAALIAAAERDDATEVTRLLRNGADANTVQVITTEEEWGLPGGSQRIVLRLQKTPLTAAVEAGSVASVRLLIEGHADPNQPRKWQQPCLVSDYDTYYTVGDVLQYPLTLAAENKHTEVVRLLLAAGANTAQKDSVGRDALFYAVQNADPSLAEILLPTGIASARKGNGPSSLEEALRTGQTSLALRLRQQGARLDESELRLLLENEAAETLSAFLDSEESPRGNPDYEVDTSLWYAAKFGRTTIFPALLARGASLNPSTSSGRPAPLLAAAQTGHSEAVRLLLQAGADPNFVLSGETHSGNRYSGPPTPLMAAAESGNQDSVALLLQAGADPNRRVGDHTALEYAAQKGNLAILLLLLNAGADVQIAGAPAWKAAVFSRDATIVRVFLEHGASVDGAVWSGHTYDMPALLSAIYNKITPVAFLLIERGAIIDDKIFGSMGFCVKLCCSAMLY